MDAAAARLSAPPTILRPPPDRSTTTEYSAPPAPERSPSRDATADASFSYLGAIQPSRRHSI